MSKAPTPNEITNFEISETIELINNQNQKYKFIISNNSKLIQFIIEDTISFPKNEYIYTSTLEELQKLNRYFLFFQNVQEVGQNLIKLSKKNNLSVIIENNICKIKIINQINDEEFTIELSKKEKDIKQEIESFIPLIVELKQKIENLEKENNSLKQKNEFLEKKNLDLEKKYLEIEKKYLEIEKQNEDIEKKNLDIEKKNEDIEKRLSILETKFENKSNQTIKKIKSPILESNIINEEDKKIILNWIPNRLISTELIFDTSRDGDTIDSFKNKCEGKCPTLVIVKTDTGIIFGGYATSAWIKGGPIADNNSFVFSLEPQKKYNVTVPSSALYGYHYDIGIIFQFGTCYFRIASNCTKNNNNYVSIYCYESGLKNIIKGGGEFIVSRMEIFKLNY